MATRKKQTPPPFDPLVNAKECQDALTVALRQVWIADLDLAQVLSLSLGDLADEIDSVAALVKQNPRTWQSMKVALLAGDTAHTADSEISILYGRLYPKLPPPVPSPRSEQADPATAPLPAAAPAATSETGKRKRRPTKEKTDEDS